MSIARGITYKYGLNAKSCYTKKEYNYKEDKK